MKRAYLIARQEFIKYITRRGFFISVLLFPVWIGLVAFLPQALDRATPSRVFTVLDRAGGFEAPIAEAVARADAGYMLSALSVYARANVDMSALRKQAPRVAEMLDNSDDDREIAAFRSSGGMARVVARIAPFVKRGAPLFAPPLPKFRLIEVPDDLARATQTSFADVARDYLTGARPGSAGSEDATLFAVIVIPKGFGDAGNTTAQYWSVNLTDGELQGFLHQALRDALRLRAMSRLTTNAKAARDVLDVSASIEQFNPALGNGGEVGFGDVIASYVPMALAFLLFLVTFMNSSVLLQGVIEEKSTRMIEVLLSCATPREIMSGKLIGVIAVALTTILLWTLGLFAVMSLFSHDAIALALGGLKAIATVRLLPLLLVYFLCGLLIYSSIFLAIGSMTASLADAQALLGPVTLIIFVPNLMVTALMHDPNGTLARALSWIPIYTPFFMMFRLPSSPPVLDVVGTSVLAVATAGLSILWTGRIFARHVLTTERPPRLGQLLLRPFSRIRRPKIQRPP
jgi:ABC-2 type transport system permease protein